MVKGILVFSGAVTGAILFLFVTAIVMGDPINDVVVSAHGLVFEKSVVELSDNEKALVARLLSNGGIISPSMLLSEMSSFYERVITILTVLISVLGFIAFMYVKSISVDGARDLVSKEVEKSLNSSGHKELVENRVKLVSEETVDNLNSLYDDMSEFFAESQKYAIQDLYERLALLERMIGESDSTEEVGAELLIGEGDEDGRH